MTNNEIRTTIAELCGWDTNKKQLGGVFIYHDPKGNLAAALPNYPTSLDACVEIITMLRDDYKQIEITFYNEGVRISISDNEGDGIYQTVIGMPNEAALCLCEAFLRLHNKWKD